MTSRQLRRELQKELLRLQATAYRTQIRQEVEDLRNWVSDPLGGVGDWLSMAGRGSGKLARWARRLAMVLRVVPIAAAWFRKRAA